jgi:branched-chain amino acid transport system permease protein
MFVASDVAYLLIVALLTYSMAISLRAGLFSIAPVAFAGLGAYAFAILTVRHGWGIAAALSAAVLLTGVAGALLAFPLGRIRGVYTSIATLAFVVVLSSLENSLGITGGALGFPGIPRGDVRLAAVIGLLVVLAGFYYLDHSSVGRRLDTTAHDPVVARTLGVRVPWLRFGTLVLSALIAGYAGVLYAHEFNYIEPTNFTFYFAISIAANTVFGGHTHWLGPLIGAVILGVLSIWLRPYAGWSDVVSGLTLALTLVVQPAGIAGLLRRSFRHRLWRPINSGIVGLESPR